MKFTRDDADCFVPDDLALPMALERTTHLCIGAHQDDQEFMAYDAIQACFQRDDLWFTGVVVTNGGGSARTGPYAEYSDEDMMAVRRREQRKAAFVGEYACQIQLVHPSAVVKDGSREDVTRDLVAILSAARPQYVYLHNPADKHDTHVACCLRAIAALRQLPREQRPERVLGCEIWRDLDWMVDSDKVVLRVDQHENLAAALSGVFDSQLCGGKRYDLAIQGRRRAHATMFESHGVDQAAGLAWAMDLTPLMHDESLSVLDYALGYVDRLRDDVIARARRVGAR